MPSNKDRLRLLVISIGAVWLFAGAVAGIAAWATYLAPRSSGEDFSMALVVLETVAAPTLCAVAVVLSVSSVIWTAKLALAYRRARS